MTGAPSDRASMITAVEDALVWLHEIGCPFGVPRAETDQLGVLTDWIIRRYSSIHRRHKGQPISAKLRRQDLLRGLNDERQPHGGLGPPRGDVECLADAVLDALGHEIPIPRHGRRSRDIRQR
jgi:hypothetical protein